LAIGLSFWLSPNTLQGIQNEIFAVFLLMTTFTNLDQQIIPQFTSYRIIYETREGPSRMYSWLVFLLANILVEIPWQTLMSALLFACWYYPIGMYRNGIQTDDVGERSALVFLFIWAFMLFTLSLSYLVVAGMNSGPTAVNIAQLLYSLSLIFCGVLAKPSTLPRFWIFMYRVTPLTYLVGGLLSTTLGAVPVRCSSTEMVSVLLPAGSVNRSVTSACAEYLQPYISSYGGSVVQYNSTTCLFCSITDTKLVLDSLEIHYSDRWWQLGVTFGYIFINFVATFVIYWYFRVHIKAKRQRDEGAI
jgi:ATP-binding cassette subfamily G (WHITE) protein 2 (PDR)